MRLQGRAQVRAGGSADAQQDRFGSLHGYRLPTRVTTTPSTGLLHMTTLDTRTPDTTRSCPRCAGRTAYPSIVTVDRSPRFTLVCAFCGTARELNGRT